MIYIELKGGIGNQLFIIAAALEQARRLNTKLVLIPAFNLGDTHARPFFSKSSLPKDVILSPLSTSPRITERLKQLHSKVFIEKSHDFDPTISDISDNTILIGYFQSFKYFPNVLPEILQMVNREAETRKLPQMNSFPELGTVTGLHVRMGDYLQPKNKNLIGVLDNDYYTAALNLQISEPGVERSIHLFSDSPGMAYARKIYTGMKLESDIDSFLSLIRLSSCHNLILSNSSFSLWAAYFAALNGAKVTAPTNWFVGAAKNVDDILYSDWKRIENTFR